jgi:DNA-binding MarR family transcriptional regulator
MLNDLLANGRTGKWSDKPTGPFEPARPIAMGAPAGPSPPCSTRRDELAPLVTLRFIRLADLMRRGGILTLRRQLKLSEIEWRIITQVGQHAPLSLNDLSKLLLRDRGQLSRVLKSMVDQGLLKRKRKAGSPEVEITFQPKGRALYARATRRLNERDRRLVSGISESDLAALHRITDVILGEASEMMEEGN